MTDSKIDFTSGIEGKRSGKSREIIKNFYVALLEKNLPK